MKEKKIIPFLLNALGEILLVVAGILIAVQIDHSIEAGKERAREDFLKTEINREMTLNLERFENSQQEIQKVVDTGHKLTAQFPLSKSVLQSNDFRIFPNFLTNPSYDPSHGTIKSIISSGDLNLIQNEELRLLIVTWNDLYNDYKEEEYIAWSNGYKLMDWLSENFPNPKYASPDYKTINYRLLQSKIGEKIDIYGYTLEGDERDALKLHMERMIELTNK